MRIDFNKFKIKYPKDAKPNNKHYKRMIRRIRRDLPKFNG
jgi:hypothetical protein